MKKPKRKTTARKPFRQRKELPEWPVGKPIPSFKSFGEEDKFWGSHSFAEDMDARGEELVYEPQATRHRRQHVYRIRFDDQEMATLQKLAKRRGVTASVVLRELVRTATP